MIQAADNQSVFFPSPGVRSASPDPTARGSQAAEKEQQGAAAGQERALSAEEERQVQQLKQRDQEVRAHEAAHMAAGAGLVRGGASFTFQRGPDGKMYAVGGEVSIDTSAESDPDQTIRKMQQVKRAALSPANPSGTDRGVAAQASQIEAAARQEKNQAESTEAEGARPFVAGRKPYAAMPPGLAVDISV